jgi:hypothetical protein
MSDAADALTMNDELRRERDDAETPAQLAFASEHAEALSCYAAERFGEV